MLVNCVISSKLPQTQQELTKLLETQQRYHDNELQKWKEIIKTSVILLDEVSTNQNVESLRSEPKDTRNDLSYVISY